MFAQTLSGREILTIHQQPLFERSSRSRPSSEGTATVSSFKHWRVTVCTVSGTDQAATELTVLGYSKPCNRFILSPPHENKNVAFHECSIRVELDNSYRQVQAQASKRWQSRNLGGPPTLLGLGVRVVYGKAIASQPSPGKKVGLIIVIACTL